MTDLDYRIKDLLEKAAGDITPDSVPPFRIPAGRGWRRAAPWRPVGVGWHRALAPLAAAAAVLAIALTASVLATSARRPSVLENAAGVPRYYVALDMVPRTCCGNNERNVAFVLATWTGAVIARIEPPKPYVTFVAVSAAAGDREFVLAARQALPRERGHANALAGRLFPPTRFYRLVIDPTAVDPRLRTSLSPLPIPVQPTGIQVNGMALSPDGTKLAVIRTDYAVRAPRSVTEALSLFSTTTGQVRTWTGGTVLAAWGPSQQLSWAADNRTVALYGSRSARDGTTGQGILSVDTAARTNSLPAASRLVVPIADAGQVSWGAALITPDGRRIVGVIYVAGGPQNTLVRAVSFPVSGPTPSWGHDVVRYTAVLWTSQTGRVLVVSGMGRNADKAGIDVNGAITPIPWTSWRLTAAW